MSIKSSLLSAAALGLAAGGLVSTHAPALAASSSGYEKCWGINSCKGTAGCGVSKSDIEATKQAFGDKYAKSSTHDCGGHNACAAAKTGELNWVKVPKETCISKGGFLIQEKAGKKVVVSK